MNPPCQCTKKKNVAQPHEEKCWMHGKKWYEILVEQHKHEIKALEGVTEPIPCVAGCSRPLLECEDKCSICGGDMKIHPFQAVRYHAAEIEILSNKRFCD